MLAGMSGDEQGVQSVRVAMALCERFAELLKGPAQVRSARQDGAMFGVSGNEEALSLRIGEAQQLYPEIWRHLDDARTAFAARGIDVAIYDHLRGAEGLAIGAAVDVDQHRYHTGRGALVENVKSANFNQAGLHRARQAAQALMNATPNIDWAGIARAEDDDPAAAAFARSARNKRYLRFAMLVVIIALPFLIVMYMRHQERVKLDEYRRTYSTEPRP